MTNSEYLASAMSSPELESSSPRQVASGSNSSLPLDILFLIWDYLKRDKSSLSSCSLVCRSWATPCQKNIFEYFVVNLRLTHVWGFHPPIDVVRAMPPLSLRLASYVKHLVIQPQRGRDGSFPLPKAVITVEIIDRILSNLNNLRTISIQHVDLRRPPASKWDPTLCVHTRRPSISRLHFDNVYIGSEAFRLLTMFSEIGELSMRFCGTVLLPGEDTKLEEVARATSGLRVYSFRTANADLDSVMEPFSRLLYMPTVRSYTQIFQTLAFGYTEYHHCMAFLRHRKLNLSEIRLDFSLWSHTCICKLLSCPLLDPSDC